MNDEKKNQGLFLGIMGVATLIITLIGATFAYFSASTTVGEGTISGQTLGGDNGSILGLTVTKVFNAPSQNGAASLDLVPAIGITDEASIAAAMNAHCEAAANGINGTYKYTGCHLYKIHATTGNSPVDGAVLTLDSLSTSNTSHKSDWKYAIFTATGNEGTFANVTNLYNQATNVGTTNLINSFDAPEETNAIKLINENLLANTTRDFYLLVFVENKNANQGKNTTDDVTGTYTGQMTFTTADGNKVQACFSSNGQCEPAEANYVVTTTHMQIGSPLPTGVTLTTATNAMASWANITGVANDTRPFYLKHKLNSNNEITESYVEFVVTEDMAQANPGMVAETYTLRGGDNGASFVDNAKTIYDAFGGVGCYSDGHSGENPYTTTPSSFIYCEVSGLYADASADGYVDANDNAGSYCEVGSNGISNCNVDEGGGG